LVEASRPLPRRIAEDTSATLDIRIDPHQMESGLAPAASSLTPVLTSIGAAARLSEAALNMHRQMLAALLVRDL
jgi:hypothetical protein